ncbi:flagellar hook-associated protein FlgK [Mangrovicoccus sp. HB161399]|uniref:flagellar hook-associated protein FlgK n=1 Tax=Mangrovicoccus sp. HB161399 TaxID=2720392 RepID=UPI0015560149|nr:flagellar hook-associated protein FlgK [Mangrovicoccus sp. HB161399]
MSIAGALSNALSGLTASSRLAEVAASNVANAMTEGYGVREAVLAPRAGGDGGGVRVLGVARLVDPVLISDRREAESEVAYSSTGESFFRRMQLEMGLPNEAGSLTDRIAKLEAALAEATRAPESEPQLLAVKNSLASVARHLNGLGDMVQAERLRTDNEIAVQVDSLNDALQQLKEVNSSIQRHLVLNHDVSAMLDQRQSLVDQVSKIIPVTELPRSNGAIALMTQGGELLLDGKAATVEFDPNAVMTPHMSLAGGTLSPLTVNGRVIDTSGTGSSIAGGSLQALFEVRDESSVEMQAKLDGFARDLVERFQEPTVDLTLSAADPGLLTDGGSRFDPLDELGLSQRIEINSLIDLDSGGAAWRLRDGLGATSPGPEGSSALLLRLSDTLAEYTSPSSTAFSISSRTAATLASDLESHVGGNVEQAETSLVFAQSKFDTLKQIELSGGVDTDSEMQRLLIIEQSYAANARVVDVVDSMLDWLMRI